MFKSARWRIERSISGNRIKSMFRLQFRVTQVAEAVGDALLISVIPKDVGKATIRLEKEAVRNGSCCWKNPVYETVRLVRDLKSGKFIERIYSIIIATGSQKSDVVDEVSIDLAEYADTIKPSTVSFPLQNPQCAAVLHVTIQRMEEHAEVREPMQSEGREVKNEERSEKTSFSNLEIDKKTDSYSVQDTPLATTSSEHVEAAGNHRISSGSDLLSSSGCSSELNTPRELALCVNQGRISPQSSLSFDSFTHIPITKTLSLPNQELQQQHWDWSAGFDGVSSDDSTVNSQDGLQTQKSISAADVEIEKLRTDIAILARQADFSGLELQTLRKQIVKEIKKGTDLTRELISLKEERDALKEECEKLKAARKRMDEATVKNREIRDPLVLIEELRQELQSEKDLNSDLRLQLHKTQDSNTELILAVQDLEQLLEQKNNDVLDQLSKAPSCGMLAGTPTAVYKCYIQDDEEQKALEELVNRQSDVTDASLLEQKVIDLHHEMEICRRDRDETEMQMEQLALDYEILKQENHDMAYRLEQSQLQEQLKMQYECSYTSINELEGQIESLENELRNREQQYSDSMTKISDLQTEVIHLEKQLEKQAQEFEADLDVITLAKIEQEQRAIRAEEALRATKRKNAISAEKLQEDFKRLCMQMASTFDANEKLAMKSINEAAELRQEKNHIEILLNKTTEELHLVKKDYEVKLVELSNQVNSSVHHMHEMKAKVYDNSNPLEAQNVHKKEIEMLRAEIKGLSEVIDVISKERDLLKAELEQANSSTDEAELLLIGRNVEFTYLENKIALITEKADKTMEELAMTSSVLKEKEKFLKNLHLELENLKAENSIFKETSSDEIQNLQEQVCQLEGEICKKENALSLAEEKLKDMNEAVTMAGGTSVKLGGADNEAANLMKKIRVLEGQIKMDKISLDTTTNSFLEQERYLLGKVKELESRAKDFRRNCCCLPNCQAQKVDSDTPKFDEAGQSSLKAMTNEMEKLKKRNISMEAELKELQERYSDMSLKFAEVEGERQELVMTLRNLRNFRKS